MLGESHFIWRQAVWVTAMEIFTVASSIDLHNLLQSVSEKPLVTASTTILISIITIISLDWLNYQKQRRRLGNIPIVGDAPYLWQRLRWTENQSNLKEVFQRGYNNVRRSQYNVRMILSEANWSQFSKKLKPWAFWGQHDDFILVLPPGTCEELKNADLSQMSFLQAVEDVSYHSPRVTVKMV